MKLRQIALAADHLNPYRDQLFELLGIEDDFVDRGVAEFGLENSVMSIGDSFFEIVAPVQENTPVGRTLARRNTSVCGYMLLLQVENFAEFNQHIADQDLRQVWNIDRADVSACHIHPKDMRGAIVSFDEMRPPEEWVWGGNHWREQRARHVSRLIGCQMATPQPNNLADHWSKIMNTPIKVKQNNPALIFRDGTYIEFVVAKDSDVEELRAVIFQTDNPKARYAKAEELGMSVDGQPRLGILDLDFVSREA